MSSMPQHPPESIDPKMDRGKVPTPLRRRVLVILPWICVAGGVLAGFAVLLSLIKLPAPPPRITASETKPPMGVGLSRIPQAEIDLLDPSPLFLPTRINAGYHIENQKFKLASKGSFQSYPPTLINPQSGVQLNFPPVAEIPQSVAGGLRVGEQPNPYRSIGQSDAVPENSVPRMGFLDVLPAAGGRSVLLVEIAGIRPSEFGDWHPIEWMAAIDKKGLVGSLALVGSSGVEKCDDFFATYVVRQFKLGERLPPGYYRVRVAP